MDVSLGFENAESTSYLGVCIRQGAVRSDLRRQGWHENEVETINSHPPFEKLTSAEKKRKSQSIIGRSFVYERFAKYTLYEHVYSLRK